MKSNELLRLLRKLLALNEEGMAAIFALGDHPVTPEQVKNWLKQENETGFAVSPDLTPAYFLEGLIISRRGPRQGDSIPTPDQAPSNNQVLKKLRIAFELKGEDMHALFTAAGQPLNKQALDALFRNPEHKNYQACSDQTLRAFFKALTDRQRGR